MSNTIKKQSKKRLAKDPAAAGIKFSEILKEKNLRLTSERKAMYDYLSDLESPIGVKQLVSSLANKMDQATVYRNIELFDQIGVINKVYTGWKYNIELSEKFRPHHHHMTCTNCGKIITINLGPRMEEAMVGFGRQHGFKIKSHIVELRGLCKNCS